MQDVLTRLIPDLESNGFTCQHLFYVLGKATASGLLQVLVNLCVLFRGETDREESGLSCCAVSHGKDLCPEFRYRVQKWNVKIDLYYNF